MNKNVINKIRAYRKEFDLTQAELAEKSGVSRQSIISIEKGKYTPSLPLALRFGKIFDVSTDELFKLKEE